MRKNSRLNRLLNFARWRRRRGTSAVIPAAPKPRTLVIILDGTMSSKAPGCETNAGLTHRLLEEMGEDVQTFYEPGIQWQNWKSVADVAMGRGLNRQIRRAYRWLAQSYRPGDRIYLFGFSRGAYAVRSMAGMIDRLGLLRPSRATVENVSQLYHFYECDPGGTKGQMFADAYCHRDVPIEMIGVWDTVKALGLRLPLLWKATEARHAFHSTELGSCVKRGCQALAMDETRAAFVPVLWSAQTNADIARIDQVWFRGTHGDVGGQLNGFAPARGLSNIALSWMLEQAQGQGLPLPFGWQLRFPTDPAAPSVGTWRGTGRLFLVRAARKMREDPSERLHDTVPGYVNGSTVLSLLRPVLPSKGRFHG